MRLACTLPAALLALAIGAAPAWAAVDAHRVKGTMVEPAVKVDAKTCIACHTTVDKLHKRGAHKDVNCGACHKVSKEHLQGPNAKNRPTVDMSLEGCATCHKEQLADMTNTKYHMAWAMNVRHTYSSFKNADTTLQPVQYNLPRFHTNILADIAVIRLGGRYSYKDPTLEGKPVTRLWDAVKDNYPELGDKLEMKTNSFPWRPHKGVGLAKLAACLKCKTSDNMLDYEYLGAKGKAPLHSDSPMLPALRNTNTAFNCNLCHDPHSAQPRVVNDMLIQALIEPEFKDTEIRKLMAAKKTTQVEVVDMGVRGWNRKIAILDRYDSNLMCGQCHMGAHEKHSFGKDKEPKGPSPFYTTIFISSPLESYDYYEKNGMMNTTHPETGTRWPKIRQGHSTVEMCAVSVHGKAGVGCTDCHFAQKKNGALEHQPSQPRQKIANTCLRSDCHGAGTKFNWKNPAEAAYAMNAQQQRARILQGAWINAHNQALNLLRDVKRGLVTIGDKEAKDLHRAFGRSLTCEVWWINDYSDSMHNPRLFESSVTQVTRELQKAYGAAKKTEKPAVALSKK